MIETRQLKFFTVAAECCSFREAAKILYTTQSNVSKVIASLEQQMGYALFRRDSQGISLTIRGQAFYRQALPLLENLENLEAENAGDGGDILRIAANPSSWFARHFSEFYELHKAENYRYNIHTDTTWNIIRRIHRLEDEIGFIYVLPEDMPQLEYEMQRYHLQFTVLGKTPGMLYLSPEDMPQNSVEESEMASFEDIRLIQAEKDPLRKCTGWTMADGSSLQIPPVAVTTNSDYIMNIMMKKNRLANISPQSFEKSTGKTKMGHTLNREQGDILYGVLFLEENPLSPGIRALVDFIHAAIG